MDVREKLKEMRKTKSVAEIAREVGVCERNIHRWTSEGKPMSDMAKALLEQKLKDKNKLFKVLL